MWERRERANAQHIYETVTWWWRRSAWLAGGGNKVATQNTCRVQQADADEHSRPHTTAYSWHLKKRKKKKKKKKKTKKEKKIHVIYSPSAYLLAMIPLRVLLLQYLHVRANAFSLYSAVGRGVYLCHARMRRSTIEVHPEFSEAPHLRSFILHPKTDFGKNQITSR